MSARFSCILRGGAAALCLVAASGPGRAEAADAPAPTSGDSSTARADAGLHTFAGNCLYDPRGTDDQSGLLGVLGGFIPDIVSAGYDALTGALDEAGKDKVTTRSATLPIELRPRCIQVASGMSLTGRNAYDGTDRTAGAKALEASLRAAPFLVEFYLRQSADGSSVAVMPTFIRYRQTLHDRKTGRTPRDLYATLSFARVGSTDQAEVSVPLGNFRPDPDQPDHVFDPVKPVEEDTPLYGTGAAASAWFKSPFVAPAAGGAAAGAGIAARAPAPVPPPASLPATAPTPAATPAQPAANDGYVGTVIPVAGGTIPSPSPTIRLQGSGSATQPARALIGKAIAPLSITVTLRETRPGSAFARTLSSILKSGKKRVVDAVDPQARATGQATALDAWKTNMTAYATALTDYYTRRAAMCTPDITDSAGLAALKRREAAELLKSEVMLIATAKVAKVDGLPFQAPIDPVHPDYETQCR